MVKRKKQKISIALITLIILIVMATMLIIGMGNKPSCGNGKCDAGETCTTCQQDCGSCPITTTTKITTSIVPTTSIIPITSTTVLQNTTTTKMSDSCTDTDGGVKYDVQGTVSGYHLGQPFSKTDFCTGDLLTEYYCLTYYGHKDYNCAYAGKKCIDGACV
jgi:hypothetical protein